MASVVSLVLTDIVGSTRRWASDELAMRVDLELHDAILREVVEGSGGVVVKHTGDGLLAVFEDPVGAVGAAASMQQRIGAAVWRHPDGVQVRAGVHTGVVHRRDADVFGTAVNRAARLMAACPPGGVLVSSACAGLLAERGPEGLTLRRVGPVALAGFATPDEAWAVDAPGLAPVETLSVRPELVPTGLPPLDDELVGRVEELSSIWEVVGRHRLVTLTGVGGMGKTRLALEVAHGALDSVVGGVRWIDLSVATSAEAVMPAAMVAVGALESAGRTALQAFCDHFAGRDALVLFDNCEHVLGAARELVTALRAAAPDVRIVCTSREALGVRGEYLVPVGSLPQADGVALFCERALALDPNLDIEAARAVIDRICARLDGIPLAIELAAARCRSLSPAEIDVRLGDRFRLLRGGREGAERHRTLQAAVAWSYEMLDPDERQVFLHLAVFAGGTLVDGLGAVTGLDEFDLLDVVDRLVSRSMVVVSRTALGTRYHQLETLRQFAEDRLAESGRIDEVRDRHLAWADHLAGWVHSCAGTPQAADGFRRFCAEVDNLRIAVAYARGSGRHGTSHEIVAAVAGAAFDRPTHEVFDWVRPILLEDDWTRAAAVCAAWGASSDHVRGIPLADGSIGGVPERFLGDPVIAARHATLQSMGFGRWEAAIALLGGFAERNDHIGLTLERSWLAAQIIRLFWDTASAVADESVVHRRAEAALERARRLGDDLALCSQASRVAMLRCRYDPARALDLANEALEIGSRLGTRKLVEEALSVRLEALALLAPSDPDRMRAMATEIRDGIRSALDSGNARVVLTLVRSAVPLLVPVDPAPVYTYLARFDFAGVVFEALGLPCPDDWSEWVRRAGHLTERDAVAAVVSSLDRLVAIESSAAPGLDG
jgi:predicted ATPase/class 3 adenylate cyclase